MTIDAKKWVIGIILLFIGFLLMWSMQYSLGFWVGVVLTCFGSLLMIYAEQKK